MTVIATDGRSMSADGRSTSNNTITTDSAIKIIQLKDGTIIGLAGEQTICQKILKWFLTKGETPQYTHHESDANVTHFECLILKPDGTCWTMDDNFEPIEQILPAAIGSGSEIALGALLAGATPKRAVEMTITRSINCGGKIRTLKL